VEREREEREVCVHTQEKKEYTETSPEKTQTLDPLTLQTSYI
jgi:hypothetical protein